MNRKTITTTPSCITIVTTTNTTSISIENYHDRLIQYSKTIQLKSTLGSKAQSFIDESYDKLKQCYDQLSTEERMTVSLPKKKLYKHDDDQHHHDSHFNVIGTVYRLPMNVCKENNKNDL